MGIPCPNAPVMNDLKGNKIPGSPETSYSIALNQMIPLENGMLNARIAYRYQGEREGDVFNQMRTRMGEQEYFDLTMSYMPSDEAWDISFYAKNLAEQQQQQQQQKKQQQQQQQ